jgi:hypothetical protein
VKCQKYQLMNCQSMPLLSLTNNDQTLCVFSYPTCEVPHHDLWIVEAKSILSCEAADRERKSAGRGMLHGKWAVKSNTACTDWKELPNNPCSRYDMQGDTITPINVETKQPPCKITKTAPGNAEKLVP